MESIRINLLRPLQPKLRDPRAQNAFTLVEMMIVVAIIVTLIALLLPALHVAREQVIRVNCQSNCRQLLTAVAAYVADNQESLPFPNWDGGNRTQYSGAGWLYNAPIQPVQTNVQTGTIFRYLNSTQVYHCPKHVPPYYSGPSENLTSWMINGAISDYGQNWPAGTALIHRITAFHPDSIVFWEADEQAAQSGAPWNDGSSYPIEAGITQRHIDHGAAMGCFDGHVEWWSQADYAYQVNQSPGRLWCNPDSANGH